MQCGRWGVDRGQAAPWSWCGRAVYLQPRWSRGATARSNTQHSPPPRPFHSHHSAAQPNRPTVVRARRCMVACRLRAGRHLDASHGNTRTQHRIARRGSWRGGAQGRPGSSLRASVTRCCSRHGTAGRMPIDAYTSPWASVRWATDGSAHPRGPTVPDRRSLACNNTMVVQPDPGYEQKRFHPPWPTCDGGLCTLRDTSTPAGLRADALGIA